MTALQQVEKLLPSMSASEKAQVIRWLERDLRHEMLGIEKTEGVCGGSARIVRTRIPVWLLVEALQGGASEVQILQSFPALRAEDLLNAWAYYRANKDEIDAEIRENQKV